MSSYYNEIYVNDEEWKNIQQKVCDTDAYIARKKEEAERLKRAIEDREAELRKLKIQTEKTLSSSISMIQGEFENAINNIGSDSRSSIEEQQNSFHQEVSELKKDIESTSMNTAKAARNAEKISAQLSEVISHSAKKNADNESTAIAFLEYLNKLNDKIKELNPLVFDAKTFSEFSQILEMVNENIRVKRFETAIANAQNNIPKGTKLLTDLILKNGQYNDELLKTVEIADTLKAEFDRFDTAMDGAVKFEIDGKEYEFDFDINHWSEGRFEQLRNEFQAQYKLLMDVKHQPVSLESLTVLKNNFSTLSEALNQCDIAAREEMVGSLKAQETAARICECIQDQWDLKEFGFNDDDDRKPYTMTYRDHAGNTISFVIAPSMQAEAPSIYLEAFADEESHSEIIKKDVQLKLPSKGLHVTKEEHLNDCNDNTDSNSFIKKSLSKAISVNKKRREKSFGSQ